MKRFFPVAFAVPFALGACAPSGTTQRREPSAQSPAPSPAPTTPSQETPSVMPETQTTESGLQYIVLKEGTGAQPATGQTVFVHYVGTFPDGKKFDSSRDRGTPFSFVLGKGMVIKGWDEALGLMKVGETRKLVIPPNLAYGERGAGNVIPPNATLHFEVELLDVK